MFLGEFGHSIDSKGRLTIPAKFRGELAAGLVVTRGLEKNLMVFPISGWETLAARIAAKPFSDQGVRDFRRRLFAGAVDLNPDRQGRIVLPQYLRDFAGLGNEVVVAGLFDYLEIWNAEAWQAVREGVEENEDAGRWADLGI